MPTLSFEGSLPMSKSLRLWTCTDLWLVPTQRVTVHRDPSDFSFLSCHRWLWDRQYLEVPGTQGGEYAASHLPAAIPQCLSHS